MNKQMILDPFQNVVGNGVAIGDMTKFLGTVLEKITLNLGGYFSKSNITAIALKANGKTIWESDGTKLEASNAYNAAVGYDPNTLKIDFMDRKAITANARQAGAFDLSIGSGIKSLRMEITISGASGPTLNGFADVSPPTADPTEAGIRPLIARRHRATYVVGAAGEVALPIPHMDPSGGGSAYRRIYIYSSTCTGFKTVREGIVEHELTKLQNEHSQRDNFKNPQANLIVFDPVQDGQLSGRLWDTRPGVGVRSAQFFAKFDSAETITIETEELISYSAY